MILNWLLTNSFFDGKHCVGQMFQTKGLNNSGLTFDASLYPPDI